MNQSPTPRAAIFAHSPLRTHCAPPPMIMAEISLQKHGASYSTETRRFVVEASDAQLDPRVGQSLTLYNELTRGRREFRIERELRDPAGELIGWFAQGLGGLTLHILND